MGTIYRSGTIITMDDTTPEAECLLTEGDRITFVGALSEAYGSFGRDHAEVDLQGRILMPAFIDAHGHFINYGVFAGQVDLRPCASVDEIVDALTARLSARSDGDLAPLVGVAYDHNNLPGYRHPDRHDLDRVSAEVPVFILHQSAHMGVANSAALVRAGIDATTADPVGGIFRRESDGMTPDGYIEEISALAVFAEGIADGGAASMLLPGVRADPKEAILTAQREYLSRGITTVQEGAASPNEVEELIAAGDRGDLVLDVVPYPIVTAGGLDVLDAHSERVGKYVNHVRLGGCKMILDGSPQARSAWLSEPYETESDWAGSHDHDEPGQCQCGYPSLPDDQVGEFITRAVESGYQVLAHCNGDASSEQFITAYQDVVEGHPDAVGLRPVMIHAQTVRDDQLDRMPALGMIASFFSGHVWFWGDTHLRNLGPDRARRISPARSALDRGVAITLHQDPPVTDPDMPVSLAAATDRTSSQGTVLGPEQAITRYEALRAVTSGSAFQYGEEHDKGIIRPGMRADLVIVDRNPLTCPDPELRDLTVLQTIKDGSAVFTR